MSPFSLMCYFTERKTVHFMKKVFQKMGVDTFLQRLDRRTEDEARTTAAQTLEVVYGLVQNMTIVMNGKQMHIAGHSSDKYPPVQMVGYLLVESGKPLVRSLATAR